MNICSHVKIKKVLFSDQSATRYVRGMVCRKNLANKRMRAQFDNPKILMISPSIEYYTNIEDTFNNFDQLVKNERKIMKKHVDRITRLNPDIIFVEQTVNRIAQELLFEKNIAIVYKIKPDQMKAI